MLGGSEPSVKGDRADEGRGSGTKLTDGESWLVSNAWMDRELIHDLPLRTIPPSQINLVKEWLIIDMATLSGTTLAKGLTDGICQLLDFLTQTRFIRSKCHAKTSFINIHPG